MNRRLSKLGKHFQNESKVIHSIFYKPYLKSDTVEGFYKNIWAELSDEQIAKDVRKFFQTRIDSIRANDLEGEEVLKND